MTDGQGDGGGYTTLETYDPYNCAGGDAARASASLFRVFSESLPRFSRGFSESGTRLMSEPLPVTSESPPRLF